MVLKLENVTKEKDSGFTFNVESIPKICGYERG